MQCETAEKKVTDDLYPDRQPESASPAEDDDHVIREILGSPPKMTMESVSGLADGEL